MSMTVSSRGREQQINTFPAAGGSSGSGSYFTDPEISPDSQLWQTPVRHDQRTGTSQASASSSRLRNVGPNGRSLRYVRTKLAAPSREALLADAAAGVARQPRPGRGKDQRQTSRCGCDLTQFQY